MRGQVIWSQMAPLPVVTPFNKGKPTYTYEHLRDDFEKLEKAAITITAHLTTPIVFGGEFGDCYLDGLLSVAAMTAHPRPAKFGEYAVVPIPLELAGIYQGLPLWACTPFSPVGENVDGVEYWHKRYPSDKADFGGKVNALTTSGRWREYRVPLKTNCVGQLKSFAFGNKAQVRRLLSYVTHIGKKSSIGFGAVANWEVEDAEHTIDDVMSRRPIPSAMLMSEGGVVRGWTPPYWYAPNWMECQ